MATASTYSAFKAQSIVSTVMCIVYIYIYIRSLASGRQIFLIQLPFRSNIALLY